MYVSHLQGKIVLLLVHNAPSNFPTEALIRGAAGVLWVTDDGPHAVRSQLQLADPDGDYVRSPTLPIFRIRPAVADSLLTPAGVQLDTLRRHLAGWPEAQSRPWFVQELETQVMMSLTLTDAAKDQLATDGYDLVYGARPLKRLIQQMIENPLAKRIVAGEFGPGDAIEVDASGEMYTFEKKGT